MTKINIKILLMLPLFVGTLLVGVLNPRITKADNATPILDRAKNWSLMQAFNPSQEFDNVARGCTFKEGTISARDVSSRNIEYSGNTQQAVGYTVIAGGKEDCSKIMEQGMRFWDPANDTAAFFQKMGYKKNSDGSVTGTFDYDKFVNSLPANLFPDGKRGLNNGGVAPDDIQYQLWFDSFTNQAGGCEATFKTSYTSASADLQRQATTDDHTYRIYDVTADGLVRDSIYYSTSMGHGRVIKNMSWGIGSKAGAHASCEEIANKLRDRTYATAYAALVQTDSSAAATAAGGGSTNATGTEKDTISSTCYSALPVIGFVMCGIIDLADGFYKTMQTWVSGLLKIDSTSLQSESGSGQKLHNVWSVVKNFATAGIVLIGVIMVASQVFSFDFISAYTVKKVLPRLVIATILIQLSWFIFILMIQFVNALAVGLYTLLLGTFGASDIINILGDAKAVSAEGILALLTTGGLAVAIAALVADPGLMIGIVLALLGAFIAMLVALVTLIVRKMIIILLLVISPFAILAWILPGTNEIWSSWWQLFSKLLFMYPLITLLFAGGAIASKITMISDGGNAFNLIASVIVYFAPFFLIPSTFKFAGSTMAAVSGGIGKIGGKVKESNPLSKSLGKAAQVRQQTKDSNAKINSLSDNKFRRARGRFSTGVYGATGQAKEIMEANEESEAIKQQGLAINQSIKGMDFNDTTDAAGNVIAGQRSRVRAIAMDDSKTKSERLAATQWLAQKGDSVGLHQTKEAMQAQGVGTLWNKAQGDNYGDISSVAPDLVGKDFHTLNAEQMATMKPETFKIMQNQVAKNETIIRDPTSKPDAVKAAKAQNDSIRSTLSELTNSPTLSTKLTPEHKPSIEEIVSPKKGLTAFSDIDNVGRKNTEAGYKNPSF